jgi:hypothetical protein
LGFNERGFSLHPNRSCYSGASWLAGVAILPQQEPSRMNHHGIPGFSGIIGIVVGLLAASVLVSFVTGTYGHWPVVLLGIVVGLAAVRSINN